jgi:hypothetical protein
MHGVCEIRDVKNIMHRVVGTDTGKVGDTYYVENDTSDENSAYFHLYATVQQRFGQTAPIFAFYLPCNSALVQT